MVGLNIHKSKYCKEEEKMVVGMVESQDSDPEWEMAKSKKRRPRGKLMKCPEKGCKAKLKSRVSLKEHIKFVHGERQGCISCGILVSGIGARGVSSEHMENMEMFSLSPT